MSVIYIIFKYIVKNIMKRLEEIIFLGFGMSFQETTRISENYRIHSGESNEKTRQGRIGAILRRQFSILYSIKLAFFFKTEIF